MTEAFNLLTPAEAERLSLIAEEASEVIKAVNKILRHGYERGWEGSNNRVDLEKELGDLIGVMKYAIALGDLDPHNIFMYQEGKMARTFKYLHHNFPLKEEEDEVTSEA